MNETLLNIALGAGFGPLLIGLFAMLIPEVRNRVRAFRDIAAIAVSSLSLVTLIPLVVLYPGIGNDAFSIAFVASVALVWAVALGYLNPPKMFNSRSINPQHYARSIFDRMFGIGNRPGRWVAFVVLAVAFIGPGIAFNIVPLAAGGPVLVVTAFIILDDINF